MSIAILIKQMGLILFQKYLYCTNQSGYRCITVNKFLYGEQSLHSQKALRQNLTETPLTDWYRQVQ
jgi:hypothetical protein